MPYKQWMGLPLCLWLAACATTTQPASTASKDATSSQPPGCVAETATRLPMSKHQCAAFGHTWTQNDIKSTGAQDVGQALSVLDPSLRTSGPSH